MTEGDSPPGLAEVEVALLGPGYAESVVVHTGGGIWVVVASRRVLMELRALLTTP